MNISYTPFNVTTALAVVFTIWMIAARLRGSTENNWPLCYYAGIVFYSHFYPGNLEPRWIFTGTIASLFLRFEYMGGAFLKFVRLVDYLILALLLYGLAAMLEF
jgi:hypothetical protein